MIQVCKADDDYTRERARWVAELTNGETILGDDDRPGAYPESAWLRLRDYLASLDSVTIARLWLQFRTNRIRIGEDGDRGFYMRRLAGASTVEPGVTIEGFAAGFVRCERLYVGHWRSPSLEMLQAPTERRLEAEDLGIIFT